MNVRLNLKVEGCKKSQFSFSLNQFGGRRNQQLPINFLKRGQIIYCISFNQHKEFYNFYKEQIVDDVLNSVYKRFERGKKFKIKDTLNNQQTEIVNFENTRVWLTSV